MTPLTAEVPPALRDAGARIAGVLGPLYPFERRYLRVRDAWMHYVDEGPRGGEVVLCLHGNPTWSFYFRGLVQGLAEDYRLVAPDHVGCGLSEKPRDYPYRLARHAENVVRLVEELDLRDVTLVVHDWGGAIGMAAARRAPDRIARLFVTNTAAFRSTRIPLRIAACRIPVLGRLGVQGLGGFSRAALHMAVERPLPPEVARGYLLPYATWGQRVATHAFVADIPMRPGHPSWDELRAVEEALPSFSDRPVALAWGERDWCFTPAFREEWERRFPRATSHRAEDAGHYLLEDAGDRVLDWLRSFLQEQRTP